tara:strand:- start:72 stop:1790 length:1719 start_codon:yes stop_codon:yes gene_type:complete
MQLNQIQKQIIEHDGNSIIIGAPGTGKTLSMILRIKQLLAQGANPETIGVACFTPKAASLTKGWLLKVLGQDAKRIKYGTFKDFAEAELKTTGSLVGEFADNSQMRRLLHQAKRATGFKGSIHEAEHIVRSFKSKAKKPQTTDEHYDLFSKYQDLIHNRNWYDRYDCLRQHLISLRNDMAQPSRIKYLFVDNAQDMNQIQLLWTLEHANSGIKVTLAADDDQCIFQRSGAMGSKVIDTVTEFEIRFEKFVLDTSYRLTNNLSEKAYKVVSLADQRISKGDVHTLNVETSIEVKQYNSKRQEIEALISNIRHYFKNNVKGKVAVITRNDEDARFIAKFFLQEGFPFTDFSRNIWEMPGSIVVIDMLEILLGIANDVVLKNVLSTLGLHSKTIDQLFSKGLTGQSWLQNGATLDLSLVDDESERKKVVKIQSLLVSYYALRVKLSIKDIFKALCFEMMRTMSPEDKKDALCAIEKVLNFKGDIKENIDLIRQDRQLNPNSQLILGPVREFRNLEFDVTHMPFCDLNTYPYDYKVLGKKNSSDRRIFFTALTRSKDAVYVSYSSPTPSSYLKYLQ